MTASTLEAAITDDGQRTLGCVQQRSGVGRRMPWNIERDGSSLRVYIACPVDDWDILFEEVDRRLREEEGVLVIEMPERIAGASRTDADMLEVLRRVLAHTSGIPVGPIA